MSVLGIFSDFLVCCVFVIVSGLLFHWTVQCSVLLSAAVLFVLISACLTSVPLVSSLCTIEMWLRAMMASIVSALDSVRHFLRMEVTSQATSCSARLLWLEMSMMMTSSPFLTDGIQLQRRSVVSVRWLDTGK